MRNAAIALVLLVLSACSFGSSNLSTDAKREFDQVLLRLALVDAARENISNNLNEFGGDSSQWDEQERYVVEQSVDLYNEAVGKYNATCLSYIEKRSGIWAAVPESDGAPLSCETR